MPNEKHITQLFSGEEIERERDREEKSALQISVLKLDSIGAGL